MTDNRHLPNVEYAKFMTLNNTASKMFQQLDAIGVEAVEQIRHLIPTSSTPNEERYIEFPNNGAITVPRPFGREQGKSVGVKRIYITKNQEIRVECYCKGSNANFTLLNQLGAMDSVRLLNAILIHYGNI